MTETELIDQLREDIVLDGSDIWRTNGYLQKAQQAGLSTADALKRAAEVSQEVEKNSLLFQNIKTRIARLAQPSRAHLIDQDLNQIVNAATSLKLSPDFVRNRWVPSVLQRLAAESAPTKPEPQKPIETPPVVEPKTPVTEPKAPTEEAYEDLLDEKSPDTVVPPTPVPPKTPEPQKPAPEPIKIPEPLKEPEPAIPYKPPVVRSFTATPARVRRGQPVTLEWEVENVLAVIIDDLGEGLSPKNRGWVNPVKDTDYTLFDANNNPLSTVRVDVIQPDRSGIYGVLFALALLGIIYWFIKSSSSGEKQPKTKPKTEQTTSSEKKNDVNTQLAEKTTQAVPDEATDTRVEEPTKDVASAEPEPQKQTEPLADTSPAQPEEKPNTPADARKGKYEEAFGGKPYDKVELGTDELGWRRARSKGRWGYINEKDEWMIQPEYEAVTPFRGNTANVFLNGQLMTINRSGEQVRN